MKASVEASAAVARALSRMNPVANILDSLLNIQKNLNQMADSLEEDIRELEDKLEKLREFSAETSGLFTNSLSDMKLAMQGILVLNNTIVNKDGTYQLPVGTDIHWFKQLKKQSELDRIIGKERPPNVGNREYKLIDLGYGKIWCWVEKGKNVATAEDVRVTLAYNEWLSRMVDKYGLSFIQGERPKGIDELFYEQNATLIKELATGIDSVTGKKLSTAEKLGKASLLANGMITIGVMVKGVLNVGKTQNPKSVKPNKKASGANVPNPDLGVVQSRVNVANGRTRFTPTRPSTGKPVSAGFEHVLDGHFNRPIANSRSIFSITADKLKQVLQSPNVVKSTVMDMSGGQYKELLIQER
ncbi:hypothetical protein [Enterococcus rivorum]|uniref:hypothetical protein n=1 Tax=Enterococcus rivorum TaxID=762845 RepID=UPI0036367528